MSMGRRGFLRGAAAGGALAPLLGNTPAAAAPAAAPRPGAGQGPTYRWLGVSGWRIDLPERSVLIDPYLSRFDTGLFDPDRTFDSATALTVDAAVVDQHTADIGGDGLILVTHAHWDHFADVPHIATTTEARVVGTFTTSLLAQAMSVPAAKTSPVKGGEVLDFGDCVVEVVPSLHSRNRNHSLAFPGHRTEVPSTAPATIADLPEGDTLAFQVTPASGPSAFFMGGSDFVERAVSGLAPDIAMVALPNTSSTHDYVPRLLEALDRPRTVVPVHWDHFERELANPPVDGTGEGMGVEEFTRIVRRVCPRSTVRVPEYLTPYTFT
ncbi:MBL fold metallo-hydrolase [Nocardiopsis sp. NRRL B-16309]|uniref:MBL fold metallo-hydrolase n=1 Tax=Nocardiopsis sp. NRRL B-16309 TaxID=1519494 RepID=UPI0006AEB5BE|nr:MBL fold metallo-hydrolase [Nocardiopsis sp. NRRL B-16309]KOX07885.1 beta-lactamase [Nocardiopsis sp. NRRL B-16309]